MAGVFGVAVEAVIEKDGKIFIAKRASDRDHSGGQWECLTGRVEQGETFEEAIKREVKEETSLDVEIIKPFNTFHFFRGPAKEEYLGVSFWCHYVSGEVRLDPREHSEFRWVTPEEALNLISIESICRSIRIFNQIVNGR